MQDTVFIKHSGLFWTRLYLWLMSSNSELSMQAVVQTMRMDSHLVASECLAVVELKCCSRDVTLTESWTEWVVTPVTQHHLDTSKNNCG